MIGLLLVSVSTFFREIGASIGKAKVLDNKESIYAEKADTRTTNRGTKARGNYCIPPRFF